MNNEKIEDAKRCSLVHWNAPLTVGVQRLVIQYLERANYYNKTSGIQLDCGCKYGPIRTVISRVEIVLTGLMKQNPLVFSIRIVYGSSKV